MIGLGALIENSKVTPLVYKIISCNPIGLEPKSRNVIGKCFEYSPLTTILLLSWFLNNLSKLLCEGFVIKFAGEVAYDNTGESVLGVYRDLWKASSERDDMVEYGIAGENLRKLISKDDLGASSGNASKVSDALTYSVHGTKPRIKLGKILEDHGLYAPFNMTNNFQYIITLPKATDIMVAQSCQSIGGYTLENLELEYETVENQDMVSEVISGYESG